MALAVNFAVQDLSALEAFVVHQYGLAATTLSAALRLMKVSHVETQKILYDINEGVEAAYESAAAARLSDMSGYAPLKGNPGCCPREGTCAPVHELALLESRMSKKITRIGIGGPVGSGKTAIVEAITPRLLDLGIKVLIVTNDVVTTEDAKHVQRVLKGVLIEERILGVETGACPHTAVREDPSMNLAAVEDMEERFPDSDVVLIESGGDNLTLTFSPALVDYFIYVIDVAAGDKIPRKNGPGITHSDLLIINKTDLAPYVDASLDVMNQDSRLMRGGKPFLFTNCKTGEGIPELVELIEKEFLFDLKSHAARLA